MNDPQACAGTAPRLRKPRRGDEIELAIEAFDARGRGLAQRDGLRFEVRRAIPDSSVRARVLRRRGATVEGATLETITRSPHEVEPRCAHFGACGGCSFQDLAYPRQLEGLRRLVEQAFAARGLLDGLREGEPLVVEPVVPAPAIWRYRNKMEFTFSNRRWIAPEEPENAPSSFALGLHARQLHSKVIDIGSCAIQAEAADGILADARAIAREQGLLPWDLKTHSGFLRHLVLRVAGSTGEILVNVVTSSDSPELVEPFAAALLARQPAITTLVQSVNTRHASTAIGERERVLHGPGTIREVVCGLEFHVSAGSFFQTNSAQATRLLEIVREEAQLTGAETVYDLYCGTGIIALVLAGAAREVVGFEIVASAVADARANAERNGVVNVRFVEGDALEGLAGGSYPVPDVCVVDPPRAGLHPRLLPRLAALGSRRIVYVSCNPAAAAHDLALLAPLGWRLARIRPIDLFPHTPHVECVLRLERNT